MRRCLICDDHPMVRDALALSLRLRWPDVEVSQARGFEQAVAAAADDPFDLIIADLTMPGALPVEGSRLLRATCAATPLLVLTGIDDDYIFAEIIDCGVVGILAKSTEPDVIMATVALVLAGGTALPPRFASRPKAAPGSTISPRQREVLGLLAQGQSNKQIAIALGIAPSTVKTHVAQLFAVLAAANRTDAAARAREMRLI